MKISSASVSIGTSTSSNVISQPTIQNPLIQNELMLLTSWIIDTISLYMHIINFLILGNCFDISFAKVMFSSITDDNPSTVTNQFLNIS